MSPVLKVSTHIYVVSKKIDGKIFMFNCPHFVIDHLYKYIHFTVYHIFLRYSTACSQNMFQLRKWLFHVPTAPKIPNSKYSKGLKALVTGHIERSTGRHTPNTKKHTISSVQSSENYTLYGREMDCIAFNKRNFRNYYNCT